MKIDGAKKIEAQPNTWAPCMVINPGETWLTAAARHRRETGHLGAIIIVADNRATGRMAAPA
jgi:hypothetical protein